MKWGRKKPSSSSLSSFSSRLHSLSHVLPASWLSKFKKMSVDGEPKPAKKNPNIVSSSKFAASEGKFYAGDNDAFWMLSFGKECVDTKLNRGVGSVLYELDDELGFPPSSCQSCGSNAARKMETEGIKKLGNTAWDVKKTKEFRRDTEILAEQNVDKGETVTVIKTPRAISAKDLKLRKKIEETVEEKRLRLQRVKGEAERNSTKTEGNITSKVEEVRQTPVIRRNHQNHSSVDLRNSHSATIDDSAFAAHGTKKSDKLSPETLSSEWRKLKEMKIEELKMKSEKQRKSIYTSRELQRRRPKQTQVKAFSPRTPTKVEICKIKAIEDMKKAKLKMKTSKQRKMEETTRLENLAVVKCSVDPEKDFKDSMIEMIMEKKISQPEEFEELLACYLTLNSDEYHDLIIKVFRQVWFNLEQDSLGSFDTELQTKECFLD